jgi:hypothetical protein
MGLGPKCTKNLSECKVCNEAEWVQDKRELC